MRKSKEAETGRFIALVKKYKDCAELTDTMLYAFIDRIEVHEATGGRTIYRQQVIDIHFNFIGHFYPLRRPSPRKNALPLLMPSINERSKRKASELTKSRNRKRRN